MTYGQLLDGVDRVAGALWRRGLKAHETVLIVASNHVEFFVMALGAWKAGGTVASLTLNLFPGK